MSIIMTSSSSVRRRRSNVTAAYAGGGGCGEDSIDTTTNTGAFSSSSSLSGLFSVGDGDASTGNNNSTRRKSSLISSEFQNTLLAASMCTTTSSSAYLDRLESMTLNKLRFSALDVVGRDAQLDSLQQCFDRCRLCPISDRGGRELVWIRGISGTGKSSLVRSFIKKQTKVDKNLVAAMGKFDLYLRDEPYSGVSDALESFFEQLLDVPDKSRLAELKSSIRETMMPYEISLLISVIPILGDILYIACTDEVDGTKSRAESGGEDNDKKAPPPPTNFTGAAATSTTTDAEATSQQMKKALRGLFRLLATRLGLKPFVIVLDDVQWADAASLKLIETLINDKNNKNILIIACYRPDEVDEYLSDSGKPHDLTQLRTRIDETLCRGSKTTTIDVQNLALEEVNQVVCILLDIDDDANTMELARLCHRRTFGNPFFLMQFLIMLTEENLIEYQLGLLKWMFDVANIERKTVATANVVDMVADRIQKLPDGLLTFLQLAALLGSRFEYEPIRILWRDVSVQKFDENLSDRGDLRPFLEMAKKEKFIEEVQPGSYQWLHDKIQEAAFYSLDGLGESLKFDSGLALMNGLSRDELDSHLFVVANLLGDATPRNDVQALAVATLFLQASEKAVSVSAFTSAARFSMRGISCLPESRWTSCQDVTLRLYSIATKSCGYLGQDKKMWELGNIVINQHNCSVLDKLSVYSSHIDFLGNTGKPFAAVDVALEVLKQLGCSFPKNGFLQAIKVFSKLNKMKKDPPTAESLRLLPIMIDPRKMAIAEIVFHLEPYFYYTKQMFLHALCGIKRVELLREGGVCDFTADAFFVVGVVIAALSGNDENTLVRWSELARAMTKIVPSGQHESRAMYSTTLALSWRRPIPSLIKDFDKGYESGMKSGDTEGAMWNCCHRLTFDFMAGKPLRAISQRGRQYIAQMVELKRYEAASITTIFLKVVLDLVRTNADNRSTLSTEDDILYASAGVSIESQHAAAPGFSMCMTNIFLSITRSYENAAKLAIKRGNEFMKKFQFFPTHMWDKFHQSLCLYAEAKIGPKKKRRYYLKHARKFRSVIEKWAKSGNVNMGHISAILGAEESASRFKFNEARENYVKAIGAAARGGFLPDAAIANERYAVFLQLDLGDGELADFHFSEAVRMYREWGADAVADSLPEMRHKYSSASASLKSLYK